MKIAATTIRELAVSYTTQDCDLDIDAPVRPTKEARSIARGYAVAIARERSAIAGDLLSHPEAVVRYLHLRYGRSTQELMGALYLDVRNRLIGEAELYLGTLCRAAVEPRAVFEKALAVKAAGFILFHNHPSGDPSPSAEDLVFTRRLADAGEIMGIRLVDHLVVAGGDFGRWVSLRRQGGW